jgi:branched-subunit amino acid transport protein AzlD
VTVITFVATVQVTAEPSDRFSNAAPFTVVKSLSVIVLSVLTVASKVMTCFVLAGVMIACLFDVTVSGQSTNFPTFLLLLVCQNSPQTRSGLSRDHDKILMRTRPII